MHASQHSSLVYIYLTHFLFFSSYFMFVFAVLAYLIMLNNEMLKCNIILLFFLIDMERLYLCCIHTGDVDAVLPSKWYDAFVPVCCS